MNNYSKFIKTCKMFNQRVLVLEGNDHVGCKLIKHTAYHTNNPTVTFYVWFNDKYKVYTEGEIQKAYDLYNYIIYKNT